MDVYQFTRENTPVPPEQEAFISKHEETIKAVVHRIGAGNDFEMIAYPKHGYIDLVWEVDGTMKHTKISVK